MKLYRYLETGHTQTSGDCMHATIENAAKHRAIFSQEEWCDLIRNAKVQDPTYIVNEMNSEDFIDFASLSDKKFWKTIKISHIKEIKIFPNKKLHIKYEYEANAKEVDIDFDEEKQLSNCYMGKLQVDIGKKADLCKLMTDGLIPEKCHAFYKEILDLD